MSYLMVDRAVGDELSSIVVIISVLLNCVISPCSSTLRGHRRYKRHFPNIPHQIYSHIQKSARSFYFYNLEWATARLGFSRVQYREWEKFAIQKKMQRLSQYISIYGYMDAI